MSDRSLRTGQSQPRPGQHIKPNLPSTPERAQLPATFEQQKPHVLTREIPEQRTLQPNASEVSRNQIPASNNTSTEIMSLENRYENGALTDRAKAQEKEWRLTDQVKALEEEISLLRKDNDLLRSSIIQKGKDAQPLRAEEYYARLFKELRAEIETWMVKQVKANGTQQISETAEHTLLKKLATFGRRGKWSAEFLGTDGFFHTWYANTRSKIQLGRHIVAVTLFDEVFAPFAFGLPEEWAKAMAWVEKDNNCGKLCLTNVCANRSEPQFSRVLMVHQSLGVASMNYVRANCPNAESILISRMADILRLFLPKTSDHDLQKGITKMVKRAVGLKNDMLEEQALYDCYWINGGQNFDSEKMELLGVEGNGPLTLCTFPGMARIVINEGMRRTIHVVKASVLMQI